MSGKSSVRITRLHPRLAITFPSFVSLFAFSNYLEIRLGFFFSGLCNAYCDYNERKKEAVEDRKPPESSAARVSLHSVERPQRRFMLR